MLEKLQKRKRKGGFTLVEVIVVLVILAILAALLVPRLTGWIDESKNKAAITEGHLVLSALQAAASDLYAKGDEDTITGEALTSSHTFTTLASGKEFKTENISNVACSAGTITGFDYTASNGKEITYTYDSSEGTGDFEMKV
ncbi:MAG: prepilin-type N-terminal cleavage/methylation domain-containing protein [Oscillospiraceae bacterium]|jgi:type IV pilus assembly protein PilA